LASGPRSALQLPLVASPLPLITRSNTRSGLRSEINTIPAAGVIRQEVKCNVSECDNPEYIIKLIDYIIYLK